MFLGDLNILFFLFFTLLTTFIIYTNSALHLLLTAELIWITLYAVAFMIGFFYDNLNILSLTFFFLILSAVEFGIGLILILFQHTLTRTLDFNFEEANLLKTQTNQSRLFNFNQLTWKI